jgi:hypothetical protein
MQCLCGFHFVPSLNADGILSAATGVINEEKDRAAGRIVLSFAKACLAALRACASAGVDATFATVVRMADQEAKEEGSRQSGNTFKRALQALQGV